MLINAARVTKVQNYIKTNILSLRQHFAFFFSARMETRILTQKTEESRKKKRGLYSKFTFRSAVYVTLISSLFSD